jgi:hypothetical protein
MIVGMRRPAQFICPCLIARKDLMIKFYPGPSGMMEG